MKKILPEGNPRKRNPKMRWIARKTLHLVATFIIGVAIATAYHHITTSMKIRKTAEAICEVFGTDEQECKDNIDNVLDMSDNEVQNNININGGD